MVGYWLWRSGSGERLCKGGSCTSCRSAMVVVVVVVLMVAVVVVLVVVLVVFVMGKKITPKNTSYTLTIPAPQKL